LAAQASSATQRTTTPSTSSPGSGSFALSGDLTDLLTAVRQSPDIRPEAIQTAAAQLASGALNTQESASESARAAIQSGDIYPLS
jgi:hypothetical protein